jgi:hypothetical protein
MRAKINNIVVVVGESESEGVSERAWGYRERSIRFDGFLSSVSWLLGVISISF